jgi:DNA-binding NarL/FixJ family response regulator
MAIRILLVDDHAILREGIGKLLDAQADMGVVGSTGDGREAIDLAVREEVDVGIVDIAIPDMNGIEVVLRMLDAAPQMQVLMLSMHANPEYVCRALQAGAMGYVLKDAAGRVLVEAVRAVHAGRRYLCSKIDTEAVEQYQRDHRPGDPLELLSLREREVLKLTVEGSSIADTAERLGISPKSIETYRHRLMTKLGIGNLPALVKFAIRHGITTLE